MLVVIIWRELLGITATSIISCCGKTYNSLLVCYWLTQVVQECWLLNECCTVIVHDHCELDKVT